MSRNKSNLRTSLQAYMRWPIYAGIFFAVAIAGLFAIDLSAGIFGAIIWVIYAIGTVIFLVVKYRSMARDMIDFASSYAQMQRRLLENFALPYGLLDENGRIIWLNAEFAHIIGRDSYHKELGDIFPEMEEVIYAGIEKEEFAILYHERNYRMVIEKVNAKDIDMDASLSLVGDASVMYATYLFDDTEMIACQTELHDERFVAGLIYIDNYDEALESVEEAKRALLIALVDRRINKYIGGGNGIVKKLEKDKYLVAIRYKFLEQLREDRFSILEDVKGVTVGNEMRLTLSIGIGAGGNSYLRNYETARAAIDLALGRGGDQAVVREGNKVTYYGGKTNSVEKGTRVKARVKAHALRELLEATDNVLIMGHKISDVDAVGAAVGLYSAARVFGKKANIVLNEITSALQPIVDTYDTPEYEKDLFVKSEEALTLVGANTLLIIVDVNRTNYTDCPELIGRCKNTVVLDHHRQTNDTVENATLSYIEPYASSACEMVAEVLQYIADGLKIRPTEADTMYAGIVIDTNNFTNKAGARTFEAAAFLRRSGADIIRVRKLLRSDMLEYKARAEAVRHAEVYRGAYAISSCPSAGLQSPTIVGAQAANELLNINGIKASFVFTYYNDTIYVIARSIDEVNVQLVTERLGGGGHMTIAGCQLKDMDMEDAIDLVKKTLDDMLEEGVIS